VAVLKTESIMSTLTKEVMKKQIKSNWFSGLTDEKRKELLNIYNIKRTIEQGTLLNEDVFFIYDKEHE
jgi:hypothetical protein